MLGNSIFGGARVYENPLCLEKTDEPVRKHTRKRWMRQSYHRRIQKKWIKRWGYVMKPAVFKTPFGFVAHPEIAAQLKRALRDAKAP